MTFARATETAFAQLLVRVSIRWADCTSSSKHGEFSTDILENRYAMHNESLEEDSKYMEDTNNIPILLSNTMKTYEMLLEPKDTSSDQGYQSTRPGVIQPTSGPAEVR
jgi:hypothetical protein